MGGKPSELTINGLDDINVELSIPDPIITQSTLTSTSSLTTTNGLTLSIPEPIELNTDSTINSTSTINSDSSINSQSGILLDVRPLVMDLCAKIEFGKLPTTCIRQPYKHHFGVTLFGTEILGFNFVGESRIVIEDVQPAPHVVWGGEEAVHHPHQHKGSGHQHAQPEADGLRIRLG